MSIISESRLTKAMEYLATTDSLLAELKGDMQRAEGKMEAIYRVEYLAADGTVDERKCKAKETKEYKDAELDYVKSCIRYDEVKNKRFTEATIIDVWRTESSNRRSGVII